jgi:hypothetical protein
MNSCSLSSLAAEPKNLDDPDTLERSQLILSGLVASVDPERLVRLSSRTCLRPLRLISPHLHAVPLQEVKPSIHKAHNAGIRVVMITGGPLEPLVCSVLARLDRRFPFCACRLR